MDLLGECETCVGTQESDTFFTDIIAHVTNRIYDGVEAKTRKSQAGFQII